MNERTEPQSGTEKISALVLFFCSRDEKQRNVCENEMQNARLLLQIISDSLRASLDPNGRKNSKLTSEWTAFKGFLEFVTKNKSILQIARKVWKKWKLISIEFNGLEMRCALKHATVNQLCKFVQTWTLSKKKESKIKTRNLKVTLV